MNPQDRFRRWVYLFILSLIWGSSFILIKKGLDSFRADQVAAIRMAVAFISLLPFAIRHLKSVKGADLKFIFATGLIGNGIPAFLFAFAQIKIGSAMAGMLNSLTPVFVVVVGIAVFKSRFRGSHILGVVIGLAGATGLILVNQHGSLDVTNAGFGLLIIAATLCYAISVNIMRHKLHHVNAVVITSFALMAAGPPCVVYLLCTDFASRFNTQPNAWFSFGCVSLLALLSTSYSTVLFTKLIKMSNALYASSVTYFIPIVAVLWGVWDGEPLGLLHVAAMAGILLGVYLINLQAVIEWKAKGKSVESD